MKTSFASVFSMAACMALLGLFALEASAGAESQAAAAETKAAKQLWTCGMHPQVVLDHPGECPICHMKLTPLRSGESPGKDGSILTIAPEIVQNMGLKTELVVKGPAKRELRAVGVVDFDESSLADVTTKFRGWIERLYVDFTGKEVHKGEPLFEIYSPDLYNAQTEYLVALKQAPDGSSQLAENARTKLRFLDVSDEQIETLKKEGKPRKTLQVACPRDGFVVEKGAVQGQMLEPGARVFRIASLGTVWVIAQIYEKDLPFIKLGQEAEMSVSYLPGRTYHGFVSYVYPSVDEATRTVKVRLEFHNPGYTLKPGMYVSLSFSGEIAKEALLVPDGAILRAGDRDSVFVAFDGGCFEPREVKLGPRVEKDRYQVLSGLKEGERVVVSGQFLLDSETNLRAALKRLAPEQAEGAAEKAPAAQPSKLEYVCPMPEHMSVSYKDPGKCPLCGMDMVPMDPQAPGARMELDHYACPMPEHSGVHEAKPGKCPKCGMTLIPVMKELKPAPVAASFFTCPMHPEIHEAKPGKCPKCGMDLVPELKK